MIATKKQSLVLAPDLPEAIVTRDSSHFNIDGDGWWLYLSDVHIPFQDNLTIKLAVKAAKAQFVKGVILNGDIFDFEQVSRHPKPPINERYIKERFCGLQFLTYLRQQFPKIRIIFKEGNHEERLVKYLSQKAPELFDLDVLQLPNLMKFDQFGIEFVGDRRLVRLGKLSILHGHEFQPQLMSPVNPARAAFVWGKTKILCCAAKTPILCIWGINIITLKGRGRLSLRITPDHPIWSRTDERCPDGKTKEFYSPKWVEAESMVGKYWMSPCNFPESNIPSVDHTRGGLTDKNLIYEPINVSKELLGLVGRWLGDGWVSVPKHQLDSSTVTICCGCYSEVDELVAMVDRIGLKYTIRESKAGLPMVVICKSALAFWLIQHFGKHARGKTIPSWALGMPEEFREELLRGFLSADGIKPEYGSYEWECFTISKKLAIGLKLLAQSIGYRVIMYAADPPSGKGTVLGKEITLRQTWKIKGIKSFKRWSLGVRRDGYLLAKVEELREEQPEEVFNISVEEDESYIADGMVVHNCGHFHQTSEHHEPTIIGHPQAAWSVGCACDLNPYWKPFNKWNHGFALVRLYKDSTFEVRNLRILDGKVV